MKTLLLNLLVGVTLALAPQRSMAADKDDAEKAAMEIVAALQAKQFEKLWTSLTSDLFKAKVTKDSFVANFTLGRAQLGPAGESKLIDSAYSQTDPASGFNGEIYAFNYLNSYAAGKFYERIVVVKEKDGKFRMAGLWGTPASAPAPAK